MTMAASIQMAALIAKMEKFASKHQDRVIEIQKKVGFQVLEGVMKKTPVDTGRARGGWICSVNQARKYQPPKKDESVNPQKNIIPLTGEDMANLDEQREKINSIKKPCVLFIQNNVRYVPYLENGTAKYGFSKQAPQGMLKLTLMEVAEQFK